MNDPITFGSLFSGAGGFDLGLERAGMQCKFQVEWDKHCQQVLQYHWRDVPKWEDVQTVNGADLPPVEVIAWGSPCQDLSKAGKRIGLDGEKSSMFFEGIRIIKEMREATNGKYPVVSIWENVAGAIISNNGADFETVIREMADTGTAHIEWRMLDSRWFRIAQRRRRIFVLSLYGSAATRAGEQQVLSETSNSGQNNGIYQPAWGSSAWSDTSQSADGRNSSSVSVETSIRTITDQPIVIDNQRPEDVRAYCGGFTQTLPAVMSNKSNVPIVANGNTIRHLTEIECERLMGWGDDHTRFRADGKEIPMSQRYKMCGNGVVAPVAQWIGERITPLLRPTERTN